MSANTAKGPFRPAILAPAGNRQTFLAALAAGADAVYCGLKTYSARMAAKNFTIETLKPLVELAHGQSTKVYIALNSLLKPEDLDATLTLIHQLNEHIRPEALIIQDLAVVALARQANFTGELHLSTLANVSFPSALPPLRNTRGIHRVVLPRELTIDEIKQMASKCPPELDLEVFIHGALCYAVSGRCYWSSFLGGKSGLRGRCVQPCRRVFTHDAQEERFFACQDLSLDVLVKVLRPIEKIKAWKIEGRKKGPHYVYYTVSAYQMLRDEGNDAKVRRDAVHLLERALGRPGTHYHFLPQRPRNPIDLEARTGSGMVIGSTHVSGHRSYFKPREALFKGDAVRIGFEDQPWHHQIRINRSIPAGGRFFLNSRAGKLPPKGTPAFLTDRLEPALVKKIAALENKMGSAPLDNLPKPTVKAKIPSAQHLKKPKKVMEWSVFTSLGNKQPVSPMGIWLFSETTATLPSRRIPDLWYWLPPAIWPQTEDQVAREVERIMAHGGRRFVLNAPWQMSLLPPTTKALHIWAGPFCNTANPSAIQMLMDFGFRGVIISPELDKDTCLALPRKSPLPLGIVLTGNWPLCLSRVVSEDLSIDRAFISPRREAAWVTQHEDMYWVYPNWRIDLAPHRQLLYKAGYTLMVHMIDPPPKGIEMKKRAGLWNWAAGLQ